MRVLPLALLLAACSLGSPSSTPSPRVPAGAPLPPDAPPPMEDPWSARYAAEATTPRGAMQVWMDAAVAAGADGVESRQALAALGRMTLPLEGDANWGRKPSMRTFATRLRTHPHIFRSYYQGTSPDNGYTPSEPRTLAVEFVEDRGGNGIVVALISSGADSPRQVTLRQDDKTGLYVIESFANVYVDIRKPSN